MAKDDDRLLVRTMITDNRSNITNCHAATFRIRCNRRCLAAHALQALRFLRFLTFVFALQKRLGPVRKKARICLIVDDLPKRPSA